MPFQAKCPSLTHFSPSASSISTAYFSKACRYLGSHSHRAFKVISCDSPGLSFPAVTHKAHLCCTERSSASSLSQLQHQSTHAASSQCVPRLTSFVVTAQLPRNSHHNVGTMLPEIKWASLHSQVDTSLLRASLSLPRSSLAADRMGVQA